MSANRHSRKCRNCRDTLAGTCLLCRDCWRLAILTPLAGFLVEHLCQLAWRFLLHS